MPFAPQYRDYEEGDFIFGIGASIEAFKTTGPAHGRLSNATNLARKPITVRDLNQTRAVVDQKFLGERKVFNNSYLDALQNHPRYQVMYNNATPGKLDEPSGSAAFRAKSKEGLVYCILNGIHLHFTLDGLNLSEVMGKNRTGEFKNDPVDKVRTVTGAELRWIYRYKDDLQTQAYVQFWINNTKCCPPWAVGYKVFVPSAPDWNYLPSTKTDPRVIGQ